MYSSWFYLIISKMYSCFVKRWKRENVDLSLYMDGTIDERDDAKEEEKKEEKRKIDEQSLSLSFVLKWTTEKWVIDNDDDQPTSEKNGSFFLSLPKYPIINHKGKK